MPTDLQAETEAELLPMQARRACLALACMMIGGHFAFGATTAAVGLIPYPLDKLAHALMFGMFAFLLSAGLGGRRPMLAFALVGFIGAADEFYQSFLPGRESAWSDVLSDLIGALIGAFSARALLEKFRHASA